VQDSDLYDFTLRTVGDEPPSFNVVLTVSNHPPFDIDPWAMGFPLRRCRRSCAACGTGATPWSTWGTSGTATAASGASPDAAEEAAAGRAAGRHRRPLRTALPERAPGIVESSAVPFLLHGPAVPAGTPFPRAPGGATWTSSRRWSSWRRRRASAMMRWAGTCCAPARATSPSGPAGRWGGLPAELWNGRGWAPLPGFPPPAAPRTWTLCGGGTTISRPSPGGGS